MFFCFELGNTNTCPRSVSMNSFLSFAVKHSKTFSIRIVSFRKSELYKGVFRCLSNIYDEVIFK